MEKEDSFWSHRNLEGGRIIMKSVHYLSHIIYIHLSCIFCDQKRSCLQNCIIQMWWIRWVYQICPIDQVPTPPYIHNICIFLSFCQWKMKIHFGSTGTWREDNKEICALSIKYLLAFIQFIQFIQKRRGRIMLSQQQHTNGDAW